MVRSVCAARQPGADLTRCLQFWKEQIPARDRYVLAQVAVARLKTNHANKPCDQGEVALYVRHRLRGSPFPPVLLKQRTSRANDWRQAPGTPWRVWDGNHRVRAAQCVRDQHIAAYVPLPPRERKNRHR